MNKIIVLPKYEELREEIKNLKEELTTLFASRDELVFQTCKNIEAEYMTKIGYLEYKVFELQIRLFRIQRKIDLIQVKINFQEDFKLEEIEEILNREYLEYEVKLKEQLESLASAIKRLARDTLSTSDVEKLKKLYKSIVKKLHPDLNPNLSNEQLSLFISAGEAYKNGDLEAMEIIFALIEDIDTYEMPKDSLVELMKIRDNLKEKIEKLEGEIVNIKNTFPYNQIDFLKDEMKIRERKNELETLIKTHKKIYEYLEIKLKSMLEG